MRVQFTKCHGSGNDFVLVDGRGVEGDWTDAARVLCDRAGLVGADGVLLLTEGDKLHDFGMRVINADGSEPENCLNGLRCVARLGFEALGIERATVRLPKGVATVSRAEPIAPGVFTVREVAGPADLDAGWWLTDGRHEHVEVGFTDLPSERRFTAVAVGNPHLIAFVDRVDADELNRIGTFTESAPPLVPGRVNVSFVEVRGPAELYVQTFERGVGPTIACGSAMAASTYVACLTDRAAFGTEVTVRNPGGRVRAQAEADGMVALEGNATWEWEGVAELRNGAVARLDVVRRFPEEIAAWGAAAG